MQIRPGRQAAGLLVRYSAGMGSMRGATTHKGAILRETRAPDVG